MQRWLLQTYWSYYNNIFVMSCKSAKKTYRSRKIRTRPIDPKEILQTVNDPNSLFDALSIKNIRKYKKDCLFTDLSHCSKKTKKKRNLKHSCKKTSNKENAVPQEVPPQYSPDKSLHVNRILDPFDMLFAHNESVDVQKCDVEKFDPRINFSSDDSVSFNESLQPRETTSNVVNSPPEFHLSTLKGACKDAPVLNIGHDQSKYMQQSGLDTSKRVFSHNFEIVHIDSHSKNISHSKNTSIHKMVKNLNAIRALSKCQKIMSPYVNNEQLECVQASLEPVVSTPLNATHRKSMCNISPIHRHLKKITLNDGDQDNSIHTTNQADISVNHSNFKDGSPKAIITPEIPEYSNQDEHLTLTSVNKDSIKQNKTNVPSIAMIGKHLPNNVSIDLFKSTLDDSTDANCSKQLNKTSFIDETEDTITSDNCCKFKDVTRNNSNDACINDDNVEYDFSKPINVQDMHYPTVSIERLRDSITQKYIGTQKMNQDGHLTTLKSVNKNSTEQTKSNDPSIAMIVKHLPNNVKTIIDLCESTLDDSTDANYSNPLKITSFIDQTENSIKSDNNCCNFKDVMKNNSNDACINDDNVEYNLSKPTNVQDAHYPTVSIERLRDSITQNYIRLYSEENQKISEKSEIADMKNDNYSESKCIHNDASESNVKNCNPKVHIRRLRESVLQRHLQTYTKDINAAKPESNSLKDEKDLNILCPTVHTERLPNSTLQINLCPSSGDLSSKKFECTDINNDNYSESKYTHSDSSKSNLKSGNLKVHIRKLRESILQQHQIYTEDIEAAKLDAKDFSTEIHRISGISIDDEKSDEAKMEQSEMKKNGYEIPLEAHLEKYIGDKQNTNLLCGSLLGRDCNDETNINEDLSRLSDDRTICNSHENPCYFSQIISDNITLRRSPNVPVNGHLHQNNENVKETLNTDKTASSPILNTNWKWNSQKKINSQTFKKSTNSFDNEVAITEGEEVSLYNSHDLTLASDSLLGTRLSNQTHDSTRSGKKDSEKSVNETCNLQFREVDHVHDASPHAGNQPKYKDSLKIKAITPNRENHFTSQNKNDSEFIRPSVRNSIVLQPGKKWERSLSILRRLTLKYDEAIIEIDSPAKGRKYRQSIANLMDLQKNRDSILMQCAEPKKKDSIDGPDITSRRSTIRIIREPLQADLKSTITTLEEEDVGFLSESCNDTIDISKLSISNVDNSSPLLDKIIDVSDRITSRDVVLRRCNQTDCLPFDECYTDAKLKNCRKIGEGVYGEVFLYRGDDGRARVMKVVPVDGKVRVNGELQKNFDEILSEIIIAMELSALRAPKDDLNADAVSQGSCQFEVAPSIENASDTFNEVLAVNCVYGRYPARLLDLWQLYDESRGSENDSPEIFDGDQQYVVLELANGGQDLESFQFNNAEQAYAVFYQVAFALAVGEEVHQFEHRDLHWGNVLCTPSDEKFATYVLRGATYRLPRKGVCATIIDYTLSRVSLPLAGATTQATLYNDLGADPTLFEAEGDYQFDIYRLMRERNGNAWKEFEPYTNILWLHYLVDKMITALRYNRVSTKVHKHYIGKLKELKGKILSFESTLDFVLNDNEI